MFKRKLFLVVVFLLFALLLFAGFNFWKGPEGYWHGVVDGTNQPYRFAININKDIDGRFSGHYDSIDVGMYNENFQNIFCVGRSLRAESSSGVTLDLSLNWFSNSLAGTYIGT
jgi:hypothetical protein